MNFETDVSVLKASDEEYATVQHLSISYASALSKGCLMGNNNTQVQMPSDRAASDHPFNFKSYFEDPLRRAYLIKIHGENAGFVLLNQVVISDQSDWNMGEFFIHEKFQRQGIGQYVARKIWNLHPGQWEVCVLPTNKPALCFWKKVIHHYVDGKFQQETKLVDFDPENPERIIFTFRKN